MRAVAMTGFDTAPTLTDLDVPEPAEGEVRVRIQAASVNGFDLAVAAGYTKDYMEHRSPLVLGKDFAGEVDAIGAGVTDYAVGDRVFGTVTKPYLGDGSFAEYVTVPTAVGLAPLPETVSFTDAAALGLAGAAAHGIIDGAALEPGHTVLVIGATGGVGHQVVQLAAAAGARVIATAHTDAEREQVTRLGAHATVDHTGDLSSQVHEIAPDGVDAVAHLAGDQSSVELSVTEADSSPPWCKARTRCPRRPRP
jgi:NADPH:quinone reductase-like Zn-dependent oxidoreductase